MNAIEVVKALADVVRGMPDEQVAGMYIASKGCSTGGSTTKDGDPPPVLGKPRKARAPSGPRKPRASGNGASDARAATIFGIIEAAGEAGVGAEAIGKQIGQASVKFRRDIEVMLFQKKIRYEGEKRARKYFVVAPASDGDGATE